MSSAFELWTEREKEERIMPVSAVAPKMTFAAVEEVITVAAMIGRNCQLTKAAWTRRDAERKKCRSVVWRETGPSRRTAVGVAILRTNGIELANDAGDIVGHTQHLAPQGLERLRVGVVCLHGKNDIHAELKDRGVDD
jgi:hypothetical protein